MALVCAAISETCFSLLIDIFLDFIKRVRFQTFFVQMSLSIYELIVFRISISTASY